LRQPQIAQQKAKDAGGLAAIIEAIATHGSGTAGALRKRTGIGKARMDRLLGQLEKDGRITRTDVIVRGNPCDEYHLAVYENTPEQGQHGQETLGF
jgi:DNA-binding HxlR family transcriptional regulator